MPPDIRRPPLDSLLLALPALLAFWLAIFRWFGASIARDGAFTYTLDDPYIHLALSRNLAFHGVWGTSPHEFASASSSLAWTVILAAWLRVFGDNPLWPLLLNLLFGSLLILAMARLLRRALSPLAATCVTLLLVVAGPLPTLASEGLEHLLHILVTLLFLCAAADVLAQNGVPTRRQTLILCALAAIVPAVRYEGLFAVAAVGVALVWKRQFVLGLQIGASAALPLALFGAISLRQGALPLPNSVFLKVQAERPDAFFDHAATRIAYWIVHQPEVRIIFLALALAFAARWAARRRAGASHLAGASQLDPRTDWLLVLFLGMFCGHLQFARWGWFFRYEAYLLVIGGAVLSLAAREFWSDERQQTAGAARPLRPFLLIPPALGLVFVGLGRGLEAFVATPPAMARVHDQQVQMARFFGRYYRGESVAANDIGAVSYFSGVRLLDLYGIASRDVFEAKRARRYTRQTLTEIARRHDIQAAALYPQWFVPGGQSGIPADAGEILPAAWRRVGTWTLGKPGEFGSEVAFYAPNPRAAKRLIAALRDFSTSLPATQKQSGIYR